MLFKISNQQSAISNQQSAISNQQSASYLTNFLDLLSNQGIQAAQRFVCLNALARAFCKHRISILTCILMIYTIPAQAQPLYFAGFSFLGNHNQNENRYPVATRLFNMGKNNPLDNALKLEIQNNQQALNQQGFDVTFAQGDIQSGEGLSLAFAITEESLEIDKRAHGQGDLYVYRVIAQILVFDFTEKKVIADFPVMVQYQDSGSQRTKAEHENIFEHIYLDSSFKGNIFHLWLQRLLKLEIKPSYKNYLQLRSVTIARGNTSLIPESLQRNNAYQTQVAQFFEFSLFSNQNVPLIPYTQGEAIGKKMRARFANGNSYQLKLPEADYVIDLTIRKFKHLQYKEERFIQDMFGAFITLHVEEPFSHKVYLDAKFRKINTITSSRENDIQIDMWYAYQNSLRALFGQISRQISARKRSILKGMTKNKYIIQQLVAFHKVIKKCR